MTRCATLWASVSVLPVPAPATTSSGPDLNPWLSARGSPWVTALRCGPFNFSRCDVVGMVRPEYTEGRGQLSRRRGRPCEQLPQYRAVGIQYPHLTETEL